MRPYMGGLDHQNAKARTTNNTHKHQKTCKTDYLTHAACELIRPNSSFKRRQVGLNRLTSKLHHGK